MQGERPASAGWFLLGLMNTNTSNAVNETFVHADPEGKLLILARVGNHPRPIWILDRPNFVEGHGVSQLKSPSDHARLTMDSRNGWVRVSANSDGLLSVMPCEMPV